jgi:hypothetical protein
VRLSSQKVLLHKQIPPYSPVFPHYSPVKPKVWRGLSAHGMIPYLPTYPG